MSNKIRNDVTYKTVSSAQDSWSSVDAATVEAQLLALLAQMLWMDPVSLSHIKVNVLLQRSLNKQCTVETRIIFNFNISTSTLN